MYDGNFSGLGPYGSFAGYLPGTGQIDISTILRKAVGAGQQYDGSEEECVDDTFSHNGLLSYVVPSRREQKGPSEGVFSLKRANLGLKQTG